MVTRKEKIIWDWLTEPSVSVQARERRHNAKLLASLIVSILPIGFVIAFIPPLLDPSAFVWRDMDVQVMAGSIIFWAVIYGLTRLGRYRLAARLSVGLTMAIILILAIFDDNLMHLYYLIMPVLFSSLLLSMRDTFFVAAVNLMGMLLILFFKPEVSLAVIFVFIGCVLILLGIRHRDLLEENRQTRLKQVADGLTKANETLQAEIAERRRAEEERERLLVIEREQRLLAETLREVTLALTSQMDHEAVLEEILSQAQRIVPYTMAHIVLLNGENISIPAWQGDDTLDVEAYISTTHETLIKGPLDVELLKVKKPLVVSDTDQEAQWIHFEPTAWIKSHLMIPLCLHDQILGLLRLDSNIPGNFSDEDASRLLPLANAAVIALENARLYQAERESRRQVEAVQRASVSLTTSLELSQVLNVVLHAALDLTSALNIHIFLYSESCLTFAAALWADGRQETPFTKPRPRGLTYTVARQGEMVVVPDMGIHPLFADAPSDWRGSIVGLPLKIAQRVIGVMNVFRPGPLSFSETELSVLRLLADQTAIAIENACLYEEAQQEITERKRAEESLRESESQYKSLYSMIRLMCDNVPDLIWAKDMQKRYIFANKAICEKLLGASDTDEPIGQTDMYFANRERAAHPEVPKWHTFGEICTDSDSVVMKSKKPERFDEFGNVKGEFLFLDVYKAPFWDEQGNMIGTVGCGRVVTKEKEIEGQMKASLKEKEVLLKEIHHRVKNNLQIVSSLLSLQADYVKDKQVFQSFQNSQNRVLSMALIHEKLYQSKNLAQIDFAEYVQDLGVYLLRSYNVSPHKINLTIQTDNVFLGVDVAVPCGLILNELISNALKHAFVNDQSGEIYIELRAEDDGQLTLTVGDTGVGFPAGVDFRNTKSLGLQLVDTLIKQLQGTITLRRDKGTEFIIRFAAL
jgi:two-component sensor histidine kinase/GAF domain-containing protein